MLCINGLSCIVFLTERALHFYRAASTAITCHNSVWRCSNIWMSCTDDEATAPHSNVIMCPDHLLSESIQCSLFMWTSPLSCLCMKFTSLRIAKCLNQMFWRLCCICVANGFHSWGCHSPRPKPEPQSVAGLFSCDGLNMLSLLFGHCHLNVFSFLKKLSVVKLKCTDISQLCEHWWQVEHLGHSCLSMEV